MKTKFNLFLTALLAGFVLASCDVDPKEFLEGEWPYDENGGTASGQYTITIISERDQGYVRAFTKMGDVEYGINRADAGVEVWIRASAYTGYEFLEWTADNVTFSDTEKEFFETKFIMPASDVTIEAIFDDLNAEKITPYEFETVTIPAHTNLQENIDLRAWKAAQTRQTFAWFDSWSGRKDEGQNSMRGLPKEMTILSNWGSKWDLTEWQIADMKYVQKVLGTKVVVTLFSPKAGADVDPDPIYDIAYNETDESVIRPALAKYAKAIYDKCMAVGYDGYDWDFEPGYGESTMTAPLWYNTVQTEIFIDELSYWFGAEALTRTNRTANGIDRGPVPEKRMLFLVDGAVHERYFKVNYTYNVDYYIQQAYGAMSDTAVGNRLAGILTQLQDHINNAALPYFTREEAISRCIMAENWEAYSTTGGGIFVMAQYKHDGYDTGGFGAYRVGLNYRNSDQEYKGSKYYAHLRKAIDLQYGEGERKL